MSPRRKLHLDENIGHPIAPALREIWRQHIFTSNYEEKLMGVKDLQLFPKLAGTGHHAIITFDHRQLGTGREVDLVQEERQALVENGLHWIGIPRPPARLRGARAHVWIGTALMLGLPHVLADWRDTPHAYSLHVPRTTARVRPDVEVL